jgi:hypothetical protein
MARDSTYKISSENRNKISKYIVGLVALINSFASCLVSGKSGKPKEKERFLGRLLGLRVLKFLILLA